MNRPALVGLFIQLAAFCLGWAASLLLGISWVVLVLTPVIAVLLAWRLRQPIWWWWIHGLFVPLVFAALAIQLPSYSYLLAFLVAWAVFGRVDKSRVPLYLSNTTALQALTQRLPHGAKVADVGAGVGTVVRYLSRRPDLQLTGIEHAWLPWLVAWLRCRFLRPRPRLLRRDLLRVSLADFDVVYAFLSPAMMPALWQKAQGEMKSGSLLISNSFDIPGVPPHEIIDLHDWKGARLYLWLMP